LSAGPKRSYSFSRLRKNFYYVQVGINMAYANGTSKSAIPYDSFSQYRSRFMSPQQGDELLADEERI